MTDINKILSRTNCASNHADTGIYQGDVLTPRYRVRVAPGIDLFCVVDRWELRNLFEGDLFDYEYIMPWRFALAASPTDQRLFWKDFDDALAFAKLLDKAV